MNARTLQSWVSDAVFLGSLTNVMSGGLCPISFTLEIHKPCTVIRRKVQSAGLLNFTQLLEVLPTSSPRIANEALVTTGMGDRTPHRATVACLARGDRTHSSSD